MALLLYMSADFDAKDDLWPVRNHGFPLEECSGDDFAGGRAD